MNILNIKYFSENILRFVKFLPKDLLIIMIDNNVADEREDVQKKTFAKWINSQLLKVKDLVRSNYLFACYYYTLHLFAGLYRMHGIRGVSLLNLSMHET